ncbi:MAG TPA: hypothetical protein VGD99_11315 [Anaerolineae bacterium]
MEFEWAYRQANEVMFVLASSATGEELSGLGTTFTVEIAKAGGAFVAAEGAKAELGNGWYRYTNVVAEADTLGQVALKITGTGAAQQNLTGMVRNPAVGISSTSYSIFPISSDVLARLRKMIGEPTEATYTDDDLGLRLAQEPVKDLAGTTSFYLDELQLPPVLRLNTNWLPTYDLNRVAAEIWLEKAAACPSDQHDFSTDGSSFSRSQIYDHYMQNYRTFNARRKARSRLILRSPGLYEPVEVGAIIVSS